MRRATTNLNCLAFGLLLFSVHTTANAFQQNDLKSESSEPVKSSAKADADWLTFRGNSASTGVAQGTLPKKLDILWEYEVPKGAFESSAAISNGVVYIGDFDGVIHALDFETGEKKWTVDTGLGFSASIAIHDGRIYVGDIDGQFFCFDDKGQQLWSYQANGEINGSANFFKENVLFGSQDATLYCVNAKSGKLVWKHEIDDQIRCTPTLAEDRAFVAGCDARLHVIDASAGKSAGDVEIESQTGVTPAVLGDQVYFGTQQVGFYCVNWRKIKIDWHYPMDVPTNSSPAIFDEPMGEPLVIFGTEARQVLALNAKSGKLIWEFAAHSKIDASPVVVDDRVVIAGADGRLYQLDAASGELVWEHEYGGGFAASPAIAHGRVVIGTRRGVVYCLGQKKKERRK